MTSGRFKVKFSNKRYNKSVYYGDLILTANRNYTNLLLHSEPVGARVAHPV